MDQHFKILLKRVGWIERKIAVLDRDEHAGFKESLRSIGQRNLGLAAKGLERDFESRMPMRGHFLARGEAEEEDFRPFAEKDRHVYVLLGVEPAERCEFLNLHDV